MIKCERCEKKIRKGKIAEILKSIKFEDDDLKKMVENIISATKLPPYMLGFNFTEKGKNQTAPAPVRVQPVVMPGDYVLASKYSDGDPQDHWCVGFYKEDVSALRNRQRHIVVDSNGQSFRGNGFRRVKKISKERGAWMLEHAKEIETSGMSVWHFARCSMKGHNAKPTP